MALTEARIRRILKEASEVGRERGSTAAYWLNIPAADVLANPDLVALPGPLSGEWAGDPTPASLAADLGIEEEEPEFISDVCDAYEEGYEEGFWAALELEAEAAK